jgi:hypothetical protein
MSERDRFTPQEWRTLQFAPFWMLSAIVGAYRRFDEREYQVFGRCLEVAAMAGGRLAREVVGSVVAERDRLREAYGSDQRTIGVGLGEVAAVLGKAADDEAAGFKGMLVREIGEGVARARGRFGSEMSEEDANRLTLAAQLLYFDPDSDQA